MLSLYCRQGGPVRRKTIGRRKKRGQCGRQSKDKMRTKLGQRGGQRVAKGRQSEAKVRPKLGQGKKVGKRRTL